MLTQFLYNILAGEPIQLVDGGNQRRSFTFVEDGIDCLMRIIENRDGCADGGIFNIGNPTNDLSVKELAEKLSPWSWSTPPTGTRPKPAGSSRPLPTAYYGKGYQDMLTRVPSVRNAEERLGWEPKTGIDEALRKTLDFYLIEQREKIEHLL